MFVEATSAPAALPAQQVASASAQPAAPQSSGTLNPAIAEQIGPNAVQAGLAQAADAFGGTFLVATIIVVWMGIPFVAFTVYAALTQIPLEIREAARLDGAGFRDTFRYISFPALKPILLILTSLSVIWDFRVFTQIYVLQKAGGITRDTNLLGVFAYRISIGENRFDVGAAVAVVMVVLTLALTAVYLRQMARQEDV